ncbi:ADE_G0015690.mRNA.1.CDS.1 [Saccharomyces cerevisiae]|nr:ADE_G0015690.mRNA.1.CDS.1 [Saccharomyces cerevisiae]CAI6630894.1 ADE_G0015690.mRNA.1.CDS.1 [Saccharomyces cerevisiae]
MTGYPDVAAFDLDYTIWPCYCDTHLHGPFKPVKSSNGEVLTIICRDGYELTIYKDIPRILGDLKDNGVKLMTASRTWAPEIAQEILKIFKVKYAGVVTPLANLFDEFQWGERSKIGHLRDGLKDLYNTSYLKSKKICLFDDESRNKEVEKYGVKFVYVRDPENGPSWKLYQDYLSGKV